MIILSDFILKTGTKYRTTIYKLLIKKLISNVKDQHLSMLGIIYSFPFKRSQWPRCLSLNCLRSLEHCDRGFE
jgi:hypothetical protein